MMRSLLLIALYFCFQNLSIAAPAASVNEREYHIKAAFIANFVRYTRWDNLSDKHFRFCVSDVEISDIFSTKLANETWFDLKPSFHVVQQYDAQDCDLLFIDKSSAAQWLAHYHDLATDNLLIVSESRGMSQSMSHINFFLADNKLRFEINPSRVTASNLTINASLLRLARITQSDGGSQ